MTHTDYSKVTTEDLMATCQNFPHDPAARECALELERRIGANGYSSRVLRPQPFSGGPGSVTVYNSAFQCTPRCEGTKDNPCMLAVNRSKGGR